MKVKGMDFARTLASAVFSRDTRERRQAGIRAHRRIRALRANAPARSLAFAPPVMGPEQAADLANRCRWYLHGTDARVLFDAPSAQTPVPEAQVRYESASVRFAREGGRPDAIACWRMGQSAPSRWWGRPAFIVDPGYFGFTESQEWLALRNAFRSPEERSRVRERSRVNLARFRAMLGEVERSFLFATGPSVDSAATLEYPASSLRIVCNSLVKNRALLAHIRPNLLVFGDDVFHFGPSRYAAQFRADFARTMEEHPDCFACVPDYAADLMASHFPAFQDRLIGVDMRADPWHAPSTESLAVTSTGNILTLFMIPFAVAFSHEIAILGADGRKPTETYFWKHSERNQFGDLMWSVFESHPSFFADNDYGGYFEKHCADLESQLAWAEARGKTIQMLTPSHIPALARRETGALAAKLREAL